MGPLVLVFSVFSNSFLWLLHYTTFFPSNKVNIFITNLEWNKIPLQYYLDWLPWSKQSAIGTKPERKTHTHKIFRYIHQLKSVFLTKHCIDRMLSLAMKVCTGNKFLWTRLSLLTDKMDSINQTEKWFRSHFRHRSLNLVFCRKIPYHSFLQPTFCLPKLSHGYSYLDVAYYKTLW